MFHRTKKNRDTHEFMPILSEIEESPPSPLGGFMFWVVIVIVVVSIVWVSVGKVDIVVTAKGKIIPIGDVKILQPLDTGVIRNILVREGEFVKKGQTLIEIDPSASEPLLLSSIENLTHLKLEESRILASTGSIKPNRNLTDKNDTLYKTQYALYLSDRTSLDSRLKSKINEYEKIKQDILATEALKNNYVHLLNQAKQKESRQKEALDIIAKDEYDKTLNDISQYYAYMTEQTHKLEGLKRQLAENEEDRKYIVADFKSQHLQELSEKQKNIAELQGKIEEADFRNKRLNITAPMDGYVDKLFVNTQGGVVTSAQKLLSITPSATPLIASVIVLDKDIGFVKDGMPVAVKIDTFSYQKYGLLGGKVKSITKSSTADEKMGLVYEVMIEPDKTFLDYDKEKIKISSGMGVTAEIKVGKRRIIEFFLYPLIDNLDTGLSIR